MFADAMWMQQNVGLGRTRLSFVCSCISSPPQRQAQPDTSRGRQPIGSQPAFLSLTFLEQSGLVTRLATRLRNDSLPHVATLMPDLFVGVLRLTCWAFFPAPTQDRSYVVASFAADSSIGLFCPVILHSGRISQGHLCLSGSAQLGKHRHPDSSFSCVACREPPRGTAF